MPLHIIADNKRLNWLPSWLPNAFLRFENAVYDNARDYCPGYHSGYWEFAEDDATQARFMYPHTDQPTLHVINADNYFEGELTPVGFGMGVCLIALSHLSFLFQNDASISVAHHRLYRCAIEHGSPELLAFID